MEWHYIEVDVDYIEAGNYEVGVDYIEKVQVH